MKHKFHLIILVLLTVQLPVAKAADLPDGAFHFHGVFKNHTTRPLRYWPEDGDFVITNGTEYFNRPLYCLNSGFRIDAGDKPQFSLYLPGRGGNLRLGVETPAGTKWLDNAQTIIARYRPGSMRYQIRDSLLGGGELDLVVLPLSQAKGLIMRAQLCGASPRIQLFFAFGGANGMRGRRGGDIGCERQPISQFFQLRPAECRGNEFVLATNTFILHSRPTTLAGVFAVNSKLRIGDATKWNSLRALLASATMSYPSRSAGTSAQAKRFGMPVVIGQTSLEAGKPVYLALEEIPAPANAPAIAAGNLSQLFAAAQAHRRAIADRVVVKTPDPFINAAAGALNVAADAIWSRRQKAFMHGAVAWRVRLLGWRGPYAGDELGWHNRTAEHFAGFARLQNTNPIPAKIPPPEASSNLSRNKAALHSNGDLTHSHYDMNLVAVDIFFHHLSWTGDLAYARRWWPVIVRHLAWERRLFRRPFGPDHLPLYEAYADIWASDNMEYEGGGVAYASAYNYYENKMAARLARLLGKNPAPYEREARLIHWAMQKYLWLPREGWFAEYKDYLGLQLVHPSAGLWSFYIPIDCGAATPFEAWQMTRYVDTHIAQIPIHGPGVPAGKYFTMPDSNWMPYEWSLNNVVMAEVANTSLAYWEANRPHAAFAAFKGCLLDSMFMGQCPGNLGMTTAFDMARGEAQRDFGDAIGTVSRALIEGLFGVRPDVPAGELTFCPGFPASWNYAAIRHLNFDFSFRRTGLTETYSIRLKFPKPMALRLQIPALHDHIASVRVNGRPARWRVMTNSVGVPRVEIQSAAGPRYHVVVVWAGAKLLHRSPEQVMKRDAPFAARFGGAKLLAVADPQDALSNLATEPSSFHAVAVGASGHRTVFARLRQGELTWWQPVTFDIQPAAGTKASAPMNWRKKLPSGGKLDPVNLAPYFNARVTQIFHNDYRAPRSPFCSLAIPDQGIGGWANDQEHFDVNDSGLRAVAARQGGKLTLPDGVPLATPTNAVAKNIIFVSLWNNYPDEISVPLTGKASRVFLLVAGSTNPMQSRINNGEVIITYADGSTARLPLRNPTNWWPIDQDYFIDDYAFRRPGPIPLRVNLKTGKIRILNVKTFKGKGGVVPGGAATVLTLPLNPVKKLKSLTVRALANEVVIGLMSATLER